MQHAECTWPSYQRNLYSYKLC